MRIFDRKNFINGNNFPVKIGQTWRYKDHVGARPEFAKIIDIYADDDHVVFVKYVLAEDQRGLCKIWPRMITRLHLFLESVDELVV